MAVAVGALITVTNNDCSSENEREEERGGTRDHHGLGYRGVRKKETRKKEGLSCDGQSQFQMTRKIEMKKRRVEENVEGLEARASEEEA